MAERDAPSAASPGRAATGAPATSAPATSAPAPEVPPTVRIGEAALRAGVSERTLRYYEELGLLSPAGHSAGGRREYGDEEIARVQQIRELQELIGLNLEEIRQVVVREDRIGTLRDAYHRTEDADARRRIVGEALEVTEALHERVAAKVDRIARFRDELAERVASYRALLREDAPSAASRDGGEPDAARSGEPDVPRSGEPDVPEGRGDEAVAAAR